MSQAPAVIQKTALPPLVTSYGTKLSKEKPEKEEEILVVEETTEEWECRERKRKEKEK